MSYALLLVPSGSRRRDVRLHPIEAVFIATVFRTIGPMITFFMMTAVATVTKEVHGDKDD